MDLEICRTASSGGPAQRFAVRKSIRGTRLVSRANATTTHAVTTSTFASSVMLVAVRRAAQSAGDTRSCHEDREPRTYIPLVVIFCLKKDSELSE